MNRIYPVNKNLFYLDDKLRYLNHGSFGATPKVVMGRFIELTKRVEDNPMEFYLVDYPKMMAESRYSVAEYFNSAEKNIVFVDNATSGVNTVFRSLQHKINKDWDILTFNHYYPAIKNSLHYIKNVTGCNIKVAEFPDIIESEEQIIEIIKSSFTDKTKLLVIDHVTSISAVIIPIKQLIKLCRENGIMILIDGAHSPGFIDVDLDKLKPDWYTGNLHKWIFAPKGTAIFYALETDKNDIHPTVISNNYGNGFTEEFDWVGTRNFCAWLTAPECINFHREFFNRDYCRKLSLYVRNLIISELDLQPLVNENMTGLMQSFWLPEIAGTTIKDVNELRKTLLEKYNIEIFLYPFKNRIIMRVSSQIYNSEDEYKVLLKALKEIL
jgi:isopenicillin-N epimerase